LVILAEARACRPSLLMMVVVAIGIGWLSQLISSGSGLGFAGQGQLQHALRATG
jgi:hypothetical protein